MSKFFTFMKNKFIVSVITTMIFILGAGFAFAGTATLTWTASTTGVDGTPLTNLAGYRIYYGTSVKVFRGYA